MPIDAVVACVQLPADKPLPKWRIARVECGVPVLIPIQQIGVRAKAFGEIFLVKMGHERWIVEVCLSDEFCGREEKILFLPVHRDLSFVFFWEWSVFAGHRTLGRTRRRTLPGLHRRFILMRLCSSLRLR